MPLIKSLFNLVAPRAKRRRNKSELLAIDLGLNKSSARDVKPTRHRTVIFPGVAVSLESLRSQIISERGGALLTLLQQRCIDIHRDDPSRAFDKSNVDVAALARQNLLGGRRRDLPLTASEKNELIFYALSLTLDFDTNPVDFIRQLIDLSRNELLVPASKEQALVLTEALQVVGEIGAAQIALSDAFGRYGEDGDREMMCLQANNAHLAQQHGLIGLEVSQDIRSKTIQELFGRLSSPRFSGEISFKSLIATAKPTTRRSNPLVTVVLTVHNAERTLEYALSSILNQTWRNIEVIVVDDCSTDASLALIEEAASRDERVHVVKCARNIGAYAARNLALQSAKGDVITCHDADDWSHPSKIERQIRHLYKSKGAVASTSSWIRATESLFFTRKSRHHRYVQKNPSSLMVRRTAFDRIGYWDEVTIGGDTEFEERLKLAYGPQNVRHLNDVLSFGLDHVTSLSKEAVWRGWLSSDLDTYHRAFTTWHQELRDKSRESKIRISTTPGVRHFPAPATLLRHHRPSRFDVVMMSDFRLYGGSVLSLVEEIEAQFRAGMTTAIHQINCVAEDITGRVRFNENVSRLLHQGKCTLIHSDWELEAGCCSMRFPPIFDFSPAAVPAIETSHHVMAVNTAPVERDGTGRMYNIDRVLAHMHSTFGTPGVWYPIGPRLREYIENEVPADVLSSEDWVNIVDVNSWIVNRSRFCGDRPVVGRHSRDDRVKWPTDPEILREAYLCDPNWDVRIMGGASCAEALVGPMPSNVTVYPFNAKPVKHFLKELDFFVYYDDPMRVEAFGRVFIEAIAAGCLVILPPYYEPVFGKACVYAEAKDVREVIQRYWDDPEGYLDFVAAAQDIAKREWSYDTHVRRIKRLI